MKILIIDDEKFIRETVSNLLCIYIDNPKITFLSAKNGMEGLALAIEHQPEVIITDYLMPEMNGIELLKGLKENDIQPKVLLFASGDLTSQVVKIASELGADHCLQKTLDIKGTLTPIIQQIIESMMIM